MINKKSGKYSVLCCAMAFLTVFTGRAGAAPAENVIVFAAASTTNAINAINALAESQGLGKVVASYGSSSSLAKQILNGAPADIFISADTSWMNYLADRKTIETTTQVDLLGNTLVLIAPAGSSLAQKPPREPMGAGYPLLGALAGGKLAMGDPDYVPAGIYGKQALTALGLWRSVEKHVVRGADVRGALAHVERGEATAGIVYATDAAISRKVKIIAAFPADSHPKILYPAVIVAGRGRPEVRRYFVFLRSAAAATIFAQHGFTIAPAVSN